MGSRIYLGRITYDVRERDIEKFFKGYGRIREILLKDGFAFVEFDDQRDAEDAVYELNGKDLLGERVHVEFARGPSRGRGGGRFSGGRSGGSDRFSSRGRSSNGYADSRYGPPRNTEYRVIVENLSSRVSWQDLKDFMRKAGDVTYADAHKREKNMGIVDFASYQDMKAALEKLDGEDLHGRRIRLHEDKSRRRGHSRSRSRSPRRTKSRSRSPKSRSRSPASGKSRSRSVSPRRPVPADNGSPMGSDNERRSHPKDDRSKSPVARRVSRSRSHSGSPANGKPLTGAGSDRRRGSMSRSRSRSVSPDKSFSRSRSPASDRSRSGSPMDDKMKQDD